MTVKTEKLLKILKMSSLLNRSMKTGELLPLIMESSRELLDAEASTLFLIHERTNELYCEVALGEKGDVVKQLLRLPIGQGIAGWVAQNREPLLIENVYKDKRFNPEVDKMTGFTTYSLICVPMFSKKKLLGTIEVLNKTAGGSFNSFDLEILEHLSDVCGVALDNARINESLKKRVDTMSLLVEIEKKDAINTDTLKLADWLMGRTLEVLNAKSGSLMVLDSSKKNLRILASRGIQSDIVDGVTVPVGVGVSGYVAETGKSLLLFNIDDDKRFEKSPYHHRYESGSVISTPLMTRGHISGVLNINNHAHGGVFSNIDLELLEAISARLALLLENKNLTQALEDNIVEHDRSKMLMDTIMNSSLPEYSNIDMAMVYEPFSAIGGDFCRFTFSQPHSFGILIADISGHGVSAALLSVLANGTINSFEKSLLHSPPQFMEALNNLLVPLFNGNYLTAFYMVVDLQKMTLEFANAGHRYPVLVSGKSQSVTLLNAKGRPVGLTENEKYALGSVALGYGDRVLLYTDGILENLLEKGGQVFDEEKLAEKMQKSSSEPAAIFLENLIQCIHELTHSDRFDDDVTMLYMKFLEKQ